MARVVLPAAALVLALSGAARTSSAEDLVDVEKWSWNKFWDYTGCIGALAMADSPPGVSAAIGLCGRMVSTYWNE